MTEPFAQPLPPLRAPEQSTRGPQGFDPAAAIAADPEFDVREFGADVPQLSPRRPHWLRRLGWSATGLFVSLALGLWTDQVIAGLFARYAWLGWAGLLLVGIAVIALLALVIREVWAVRRLSAIDHLRAAALASLAGNRQRDALRLAHALQRLYRNRPELARTEAEFAAGLPEIFDGGEIVRYAERRLMHPLDAEARALTAASARRVALVTTVSPRALVDIAFVIFESARLVGAISRLYGARPGFFGFLRVARAVLNHLAVTGGLVLTDGLVGQLVGQGLAARLSQRLGEGIVNGLMTVRVGIATMRVVRPLPYTTERAPQVRDFLAELTRATNGPDSR